ncbi:histidinol dehydrogenase [Alphaproteobacteria bacterium]|nr:histidinol dehydrogenase [Alphaproteobacteria bacterium]
MRIVTKNWILSNLTSSLQTSSSVATTVNSIIEDIKKRGDQAVLQYVQKFENSKATIKNIKLSKQDLKSAYQSISKEDKQALKLAYKRIYYYHAKQKKNFLLLSRSIRYEVLYSVESY